MGFLLVFYLSKTRFDWHMEKNMANYWFSLITILVIRRVDIFREIKKNMIVLKYDFNNVLEP